MKNSSKHILFWKTEDSSEKRQTDSLSPGDLFMEYCKELADTSICQEKSDGGGLCEEVLTVRAS